MRNQGIGSWIRRRAATTPHETALIVGERQSTYATLAADVAATAGVLAATGVRWGDRVCYVGVNHKAALTAAFAAGLLGAVYVPLSHRRPAADLVAIADDAGCRLVLYGPEAHKPSSRSATAGAVSWPPGEPVAGEDALEDLLAARSRPEPPDVPVGLDDLCFLLYTSGTTGHRRASCSPTAT